MNTEQQLQLATPTQSARLRKLGFDWECEYHYDEGACGTEFPKLTTTIPATRRKYYSPAPTTAHALMWCDAEKGIKNGLLPKGIAGKTAYCWWYAIENELTSEFVTTSGATFERGIIERILLDKVLGVLESTQQTKRRKTN